MVRFPNPPAVLRWKLIAGGLFLVVMFALALTAAANPTIWKLQWPKTDFSKRSIDFDEIMSGGPPKDGIPAIDHPKFVSVARMVESNTLVATEPVIGVEINGEAKAYPLRILIWHEIVNDMIGGVPVAVTFCPLCNSAVVFDRRLGGRVLYFGTTGKLRKSDLVMYDRQTESWWQQFLGEGIVGELTGKRLTMLPARVESFARFRVRAPAGKVLVKPAGFSRAYGMNPYGGYDSKPRPFLYRGSLPKDIAPMAYVLAVGKRAWSLELIKKKKRIEAGDLIITWFAGQNSALDHRDITQGRDIGNVVVQRRTTEGLQGVVHDLTFAFVFHAFSNGATIQQ
jgi:hypothetical protein